MEIHTKDKVMREHFKKSLLIINKQEEKKWSEYELRLLIQDELSSMFYPLKKMEESVKEPCYNYFFFIMGGISIALAGFLYNSNSSVDTIDLVLMAISGIVLCLVGILLPKREEDKN